MNRYLTQPTDQYTQDARTRQAEADAAELEEETGRTREQIEEDRADLIINRNLEIEAGL